MTEESGETKTKSTHLDRMSSDRLYYRMFVTKACRYAADKRKSFNNKLSIFSISTLSLSVIALSILGVSYVDNIPENMQHHITATTLILSVFIIILSVIEFNNDDALSAFSLRQNAREISRLHSQYEAEYDAINEEKRRKYSSQYDEILDRCIFNHDDIDYKKIRLDNADYFRLGGWRLFASSAEHLVLMVEKRWLYFLTIIGPVIMVALFVQAINLGNGKDPAENMEPQVTKTD